MGRRRNVLGLPALAVIAVQALGQLHGRVDVAYEMREAGANIGWPAGETPTGGFVWTVPSLDPCQPIAHSIPQTSKPPLGCPTQLRGRP